MVPSNGLHVAKQSLDVGIAPARLDRIVRRLEFETTKGDVTSASVLVARQGAIVLHRGFGKLSPAANAPATQPDTVYLLASITKPVTACALMLLVERGQVALTTPLYHYMPEFRGKGEDQKEREKVKVWHLLAHRSGLPDMLPENAELRRQHAPLSEFVNRALSTPLLFEPGTRFSYQSMGTLLAGEIVQRISGEPLRNFLDRELLKPLGMTHTALGLGKLKQEDTAFVQKSPRSKETDAEARHHGANSTYWRNMGHPWGGMHSTTGDLAQLLHCLLNAGRHGEATIFAPATVAAMTQDRNADIQSPFGLGWALRDSKAASHFGDLCTAGTFGHIGATGTVAWADPVRQMICILLTTQPKGSDNGILLNSISNLAQASIIS